MFAITSLSSWSKESLPSSLAANSLRRCRASNNSFSGPICLITLAGSKSFIDLNARDTFTSPEPPERIFGTVKDALGSIDFTTSSRLSRSISTNFLSLYFGRLSVLDPARSAIRAPTNGSSFFCIASPISTS